MGLGKTFSLAREPGGKQALATLLVLSVLVCHGLYGAMHQVMAVPGPAMQGHTPEVSHAGHGQNASGGLLPRVATLPFPEPLIAHAGDGGAAGVLAYAAALIFVSAVLLHLPSGVRLAWCARPPGASLRRLGHRTTGRCLPPSIYTLQVFRL